jgi:hypothetical protein
MRFSTYFHSLVYSLTQPQYYIDILNAKLRFSIKFLLMSYVFLAIVAGVLFAILDRPKIETAVLQAHQQVIDEFPVDQEITWNGLQFSTNLETTYSIPFPQLPDLTETPPLLLQFNPAVNSTEDIAKYSQKGSFLFVGRSNLFVFQPDNSWSELPLIDLLGTDYSKVTKQTLIHNKAANDEHIRRLSWIASVAFPFFFFFISFPFRFISVLMDTILIFVIIKIFGLPLSFKKTLQISVHIMVAAELLTILTATIATTLPMFALAFWSYTLIVYWVVRNVKILPTDAAADREKG